MGTARAAAAEFPMVAIHRTDRGSGPAWQAHLPYTVVVVQLWYSGVKMLSRLVCYDPQLVRIGLPVRVGFEVVHTGIALPKFFPWLQEAGVSAFEFTSEMKSKA